MTPAYTRIRVVHEGSSFTYCRPCTSWDDKERERELEQVYIPWPLHGGMWPYDHVFCIKACFPELFPLCCIFSSSSPPLCEAAQNSSSPYRKFDSKKSRNKTKNSQLNSTTNLWCLKSFVFIKPSAARTHSYHLKIRVSGEHVVFTGKHVVFT